MAEIAEFDPITTPGGYVRLTFEYPCVSRRNISPTTAGGSIATHHGYIQKKRMLIMWHPLSLNIESNIIIEERNGYNREGEPQTTPVIDETVNLFNTVVDFVRYTNAYQSSGGHATGNYSY